MVGALLFVSRHFTPAGLGFVVVEAAAACLLYVALFIVAVGRHDREQYTARLRELTRRGRDLAPAA